MNIIEIYPARCVNCRKCIDVCPSPLANVITTLDDGKQIVDIDQEKCIACGECIRHCEHGARDYEDDTEKFFKDLGNRKIVIIAHPAIKAAFGKRWQAVLKWFKQNGSDGLYDGALGADICTWRYYSTAPKHVISQHCPAIVRYMEIYHPDRMDEVAPIHSPTSCEAVYIRDYVKKNYAVAALTPCPAMKLEFEESGHVEYNITFKRLREYFHRKRIDFRNTETDSMLYDFDDQVQGVMGGIYSAPGGLRYNLAINDPAVVAVSGDGADTVYGEIENFLDTDPDERPDIFEALSCAGGCGMGIGVCDLDEMAPLEVKKIHRKIEIDARSRRKVSLNGLDKQFKQFEDRLNPKSLVRKFEDLPEEAPSKEMIDEHLAALDEFFRSLAPASEKAEPEQPPQETVKAEPAEPVQAAASEAPSAQSAAAIKEAAALVSADIASIRGMLPDMLEGIAQSSSIASIMENILIKVTDFCSSTETLDENSLPQLVTILEKLKTAIASLSFNLSDGESRNKELLETADRAAANLEQLEASANALF